MIRLITRCTKTALKLPVAIAWDCLSLGNMGEGTSTGKILREHNRQKRIDDIIQLAQDLRKLP